MRIVEIKKILETYKFQCYKKRWDAYYKETQRETQRDSKSDETIIVKAFIGPLLTTETSESEDIYVILYKDDELVYINNTSTMITKSQLRQAILCTQK